MHAHLYETWKTFNVINIGHLHCVHPRFADIEELQEVIIKWLLTTSASSKIMSKFPQYYKKGDVELPAISLQRGKPFFGSGNTKINAVLHRGTYHSTNDSRKIELTVRSLEPLIPIQFYSIFHIHIQIFSTSHNKELCSYGNALTSVTALATLFRAQ